MKKNILAAFFLSFFVLLTVQCTNDVSDGYFGGDRSVLGRPEGRLSENRVILVLNDVGLDRQFGIENFSEMRASKVEDLTADMVTLIQKQLEAERTGNWEKLQYHVDQGMLMDVDSFRRILRVTFCEHSRINVRESARFLLESREYVMHAGPDHALEFDGMLPNPLPTYWANQQANYNAIMLPQAWAIERGSTAVRVGVLDSGFSPSHPDSRVNISASRDFSNSPYGIIDINGHGTRVTGVIATAGRGVIGVCWNVMLISLKVGENVPDVSYVIKAISHAALHAIPILNLSFSTYHYVPCLKYQIRNFPGLVVAAAGNQRQNINLHPRYPASFTLDNLITVGASLNDIFFEHHTTNWSYPRTHGVDLFAPGSVFTTHLGGTHGWFSGTSAAAALVTGVAALIRSKYPSIRAQEIRALILQSVDVDGALYHSVTSGRLNAYRALNGNNLFGGGTGTANDPFRIKNIHHLRNTAHALTPNRYFRLENDIVIPDGTPHRPIASFVGHLNGNGRTISNLFIEQTASAGGVGLFVVNRGTITNLNVNGQIRVSSQNSLTFTAGLIAGLNEGLIENVTTNSHIIGSYMIYNSNSPSATTGGIVGRNMNRGIIRGSVNNGNIFSVGTRGGIAGINSGSVINNHNNGLLLP